MRYTELLGHMSAGNNVVNFSDYRKNESSILNITQQYIEQDIRNAIRQITNNSAANFLPIRSPAFMVSQKGLSAVEYLFLNLPLASSKMLASAEKLAVRIALANFDELIAALKQDQNKLKSLNKLAEKAPEPENVYQFISWSITENESRIKLLQNIMYHHG